MSKRTLRRVAQPDTRPIIEKMADIKKDDDVDPGLDLGSQELVLELRERAAGGMVSMGMDALEELCRQHMAEANPLVIVMAAGAVDVLSGTAYWRDPATVEDGWGDADTDTVADDGTADWDDASRELLAELRAGVKRGLTAMNVAAFARTCRERGAEVHPDAITQAAGRRATKNGVYLWYVPVRTADDSPAEPVAAEPAGDALLATGVEKEAALQRAMELDADLVPWSDGRDWDDGLVVREILQFGERLILDTYELGRRLIWAKKVIGHTKWSAWCEQNLPWGHSQIKNYMQVSAWLQPHKKLLGPAAKLGVKKLVELTRIPPELERELADEGTVNGKTLDELADMPYPQMRDHLKAEKKARALAEDALEHTRKRAEAAEVKLRELQARVGAIRTESSAELGKRLDQAQDKVDLALFDVALILDGAAGRWAELDDQAKARCAALLAYLRDMAQLLDCRHRNTIGEFVAGAEWPDQVLDDARAPALYPLPMELMPEVRGE